MIVCYVRPGDLPSWLALQPTAELARNLGIKIDWRPVVETVKNLPDSNLKPGEDDPLAAYKARRAVARQGATRRERERQCERLNIKVSDTYREVDPLLVSLGLIWINERDADQVPEFLDAACRYLYTRQGDDQDVDQITQLISGAGVSSDGFSSFVHDQRETLLEQQTTLIDDGILGAPTYLVEDQIFLGREHLPLIRWMLTGRQGQPPV